MLENYTENGDDAIIRVLSIFNSINGVDVMKVKLNDMTMSNYNIYAEMTVEFYITYDAIDQLSDIHSLIQAAQNPDPEVQKFLEKAITLHNLVTHSNQK